MEQRDSLLKRTQGYLFTPSLSFSLSLSLAHWVFFNAFHYRFICWVVDITAFTKQLIRRVCTRMINSRISLHFWLLSKLANSSIICLEICLIQSVCYCVSLSSCWYLLSNGPSLLYHLHVIVGSVRRPSNAVYCRCLNWVDLWHLDSLAKNISDYIGFCLLESYRQYMIA